MAKSSKNTSKSPIEGSNLSKSALDRQVQGNHYKNFKIQPIEFIVKNKLDFIQGNIIKYALRNKAGEDPIEKWNKIIHYCELQKELLKNDTD